MYLELQRTSDDGVQALGTLSVFNEKKVKIVSFASLELSWRFNQKQNSCIPCGWYVVKKRFSGAHGWHLHLQNVINRQLILIHAGNFHQDTKGCILIGLSLLDVNKDGYLDVVNSRVAMSELLEHITGDCILKIFNAEGLWLQP